VSRDRLRPAIATLLAAGAAEAADVLGSLSGATLIAGEPSQRDNAGRLLDLLMDGLRYGAQR
jgi:hypothetical protein